MAKILNFPTKNKNKIKEELPIDEATHWVCQSVISKLQNALTPNKAYELLYINNDYYIMDDMGNYSVYHLTVPGRFIAI